VIHILVFLSGAAALVYEVVWARQLTTFLGITTHAHTVVLASFMGGLALGSWWLGRRADRVDEPLLLFARLEAAIGGFGLATIALVPLLQKIYVAIAPETATGWAAQATRLLMATAAVLPPTILMGGTLPALVRGLRPGSTPLARTIAGVYAANTLGAAGGALACGYILLPSLGARGSLLVAVGLNAVVALGILGRQRLTGQGVSPDEREEPQPPFENPLSVVRRRALLIAFGFSGAAALALQLGWIRALAQVIGSSVYAFGLTTASYLVGVAGGSFLAAVVSRLFARRGWTIRAAAALEAGVGLSVLAGVPILERLPEIFLLGYRFGVHDSFPRLQVFAFALASAVMVVPTLCIGALYPLLTARSTRRAEETGRGVGAAVAANAAGTVAGTLLAGLFLLPLIGARGLLMSTAVASALVAAGILLVDTGGRRHHRVLTATAGIVAFLFVAAKIPRWDPAIMTSGPFINAARFVDVPPGERLREWLRNRSRILYYREGIEATVSVRDVGDERLLVINGKTDGSRFGDRRTQLALGHIPLLSHPAPRRVLLVGLGTGMSAGAASAHPDVEALTVVELSAEVIEASEFFSRDNDSVLSDPRVEIVRADARNYLLTASDRFDVIVSEPSNPWITGVANLFTREFFEQARRRLEPGGVMAQWFQTYGMSSENLESVLRSFSDVFPHVTVWSPQLGDLLFLGSLDETSLSVEALRRVGATRRGRSQLGSVDLLEPESVSRLYLLDDRGVRSLVSEAEPNTDDRPRVEFSAPKDLYSETTVPNLVAIIEHLDGRSLIAPIHGSATVTRSDEGETVFSALDLSILIDGQIPVGVEWRVTWTALFHEDEKTRSAGVSSRPVIVIGEKSAPIEIEQSHEPGDPGTDGLLAWIRRHEPDSHSPETTALGTGEPAVQMHFGGDGDGGEILVWRCGLASEPPRATTYVARVPTSGDRDGAILTSFAQRLRCQRAEP
jgi:spermidine synthase